MIVSCAYLLDWHRYASADIIFKLQAIWHSSDYVQTEARRFTTSLINVNMMSRLILALTK